MSAETFHLAVKGTLAAALKPLLDDRSWGDVRKLILSRHVQVNGNLCLDPQRSVQPGDVVKLYDQPLAAAPTAQDVRLVYVDDHLLVVQKPAGITTLRHREETDLPQRRKQIQPTLDELVQKQLAEHLGINLSDANPTGKRESSNRGRRSRHAPPD